MTEAEYEADSQLIEEIPSGDKSYAFSVRLPKNWISLGNISEKGDIGNLGSIDSEVFVPLARFETPPRIEEKSIFRVRSLNLNTLINADDWLIGYMLEMGFSLEGINAVSARRVETQYTQFIQGEPMATRAVAEISGTKIILAEFLVHQDNYKAEKDQQVLAMKSFHLTQPDTSPSVEMKTHTFIDIAKFDYPGTWLLYSPGITTIDRMEASVLNIRGAQYDRKEKKTIALENIKLDGRIDLTLAAKSTGTDFGNEIKLIKANLSEKNLTLGQYIETPPTLVLHSAIKSQKINVYAIESADKKLVGYEFWVAILETGARIYTVRLLTIGRGEDFIIWAQNVATFNALLKSLAPANDTE
ncbi:MAG: hypothetical protein WC043_05220 [Pseudobdellovibrionaceae bacterium]